MLINSLETMEKIVENNKTLSWDGWNVIESKPSPTGWMDTAGAYVNGVWTTRKIFALSDGGWEIPTKFVGKNEK